jgi:hypothetical protein
VFFSYMPRLQPKASRHKPILCLNSHAEKPLLEK